MSNYFHKLNSGKNLKIGTWILKDRYKPNDRKFRMFCELFGWHKKIFVYNLGPYHVNKFFAAPLVTDDYPFPINSRSTLTSQENHLLRQAVNELLRTKVLENSTSDYSAPCKPFFDPLSGKLQIHVDWSFLNSIILARQYPIPTYEDTVCQVEKSYMFSSIVIKDVFHQYSLTDDSKHKTAFETDFGRFQFTTLHEGLKNSEEYIQEMFENILYAIDQHSIKIRLGEILVHSLNYFEHISILEKIFISFLDANIKVDAERSVFLMEEINYLGFNLNENGISIDLDSLNKIRFFPIPRNLAELKEFLKLIERYKIFVDEFDQVAEPLVRLKSSRIGFYWNANEQKSFDSLKRTLSQSQPLPYKQRYEFIDTSSVVTSSDTAQHLAIESRRSDVSTTHSTTNSFSTTMTPNRTIDLDESIGLQSNRSSQTINLDDSTVSSYVHHSNLNSNGSRKRSKSSTRDISFKKAKVGKNLREYVDQLD